jgi:hypothetical protein
MGEREWGIGQRGWGNGEWGGGEWGTENGEMVGRGGGGREEMGDGGTGEVCPIL